MILLNRISFSVSSISPKENFSQPGGANCEGFMQGLGDSTEGKRRPLRHYLFLLQERRGTPGEAPLALAESVATERRRAWEKFFQERINLSAKRPPGDDSASNIILRVEISR